MTLFIAIALLCNFPAAPTQVEQRYLRDEILACQKEYILCYEKHVKRSKGELLPEEVLSKCVKER